LSSPELGDPAAGALGGVACMREASIDEEKTAEHSYVVRGVGVGQPAGGENRRRWQGSTAGAALCFSREERKKMNRKGGFEIL